MPHQEAARSLAQPQSLAAYPTTNSHTWPLFRSFVSRSEELHVSSVDVHPPIISDHSVITLQIPGKQGKTYKKKISYRKIDSIDVSALRQDLDASSFVTFASDDVEELAAQYQNDLREVLDHHAPLIQKTIRDRSVTPWFTDECKELKSKKRKAEREYRSDKSTIRLELLRQAVKNCKQCTYHAKARYYQHAIKDCDQDQKSLFKIVNKLLHSAKLQILPSHTDAFSLANSFSMFFKAKIDKIGENFNPVTPDAIEVYDVECLEHG